MPNRCVLYTVSINQYDRPSSIGANVTCDTLFLHDANATRLSKWTAVRVTPTEGYSAKLKTSELKLRQPPFLRNSGYAHTIYIDANVGVRQDPAELLELQKNHAAEYRREHFDIGSDDERDAAVVEVFGRDTRDALQSLKAFLVRVTMRGQSVLHSCRRTPVHG